MIGALNLHSFYQLRVHKIHKFKPKVAIQSEVGPFIFKTVTTIPELKEALALRYEVFKKEMLGETATHGVDVDEYDFDCDHLVIKDKRTEKVIGTYRLRSSLHTNKFYSANEFELTTLLQQPGVKLELGRACIHKDYRRGAVISLLWRGIAEYMSATDAKILFGCATVMTEDPHNAAVLTKYFEEEGRVAPAFRARPTSAYTLPKLAEVRADLNLPLTETQREQVESLLPPLCRAYLKIGAYLGGEPAWDKEFRCIDFLTILHREDLNRTLWKRFKLDSAES